MVRKKKIPWQRYPHIDLLTSNAKLRRMLLGKYLTWTIKEDGENVTIWQRKRKYFRGTEIIISSHNQEIASSDMQSRVKSFPEYGAILQLIHDNPTYRVIVEECRKGLSITRVKTYPENVLIVVDIFDTAIMNFLPYTLVYQTCFHYHIPVVQLFSVTRHKTLRDLLAYKNYVLKYCIDMHEEGMVLKAFDNDSGEYLLAKVKQDTPEPIAIPKIQSGTPVLPPIPENEIMGAISHVDGDFGLTGNPKDDMPRIARAVQEECRKHHYASRGNLFGYYQTYLQNRESN